MHNKQMSKNEAVEIFGSVKELAKALGVSVYAIYMWTEKDNLSQKRIDQINGAAMRLGKLAA